MLLLFTFLLTWMPLPEGNSASPIATNMTNIARRRCRTQCGSLTVHYPFGIDKGCSMDESFELTCNSTYDPPKLFIGASNTEIYSTSDLEMRIYNPVSYKCYDASGNVSNEYNGWTYLDGTPFTFSHKNKFTVTGCDDYALILGTDGVEFTGCFGSCSNASDVHDGDCSGFGCCQTGIPKGLKSYNNTVLTLDSHTAVQSFNPCGFAFLGDEDSFQFGGARDLSNATEFYDRISASVPVVVDWVIGGNCSQATECKGNSVCNDTDISGYRCSCKEGYEGNPYLDPGCQDINECKDKSRYPCYGDCKNTQGGYVCSCSAGHTGDAKMADGCAPIAKYSKFPAMVFSLALVFGFMAILFGITGICLGIRKRKLIKLREKFFAQNGGVFLKQKLKAPGASDSVTIFSTQQLRVATDNYSKERIVGRGGHGVVYKGILSGERVVAIKKSKLVDRTPAEQFINEVLILTQVNHRNVVKLLGFCLEEEVPILVYEFISNNTLSYHIHHISGGMSWLSWENRLRVAAEAAAALAYLHSQATMPIIHRDVKSTNILLYENYTTKISDFGVSRLVPLDHDQVTTLVQGTIGYLDPQYFHTSQLTDKSDVYSFGVVLAELITGKKPLSPDRINAEKNLATHFLKSMEENRFSQIIEPRLLREATLENLQGVAGLARRCLNLIGENRPTMKEVAMELEGFRLFTTHPRVQQQTLESRSLILEVEQSYTGMSEMDFQEPR